MLAMVVLCPSIHFVALCTRALGLKQPKLETQAHMLDGVNKVTSSSKCIFYNQREFVVVSIYPGVTWLDSREVSSSNHTPLRALSHTHHVDRLGASLIATAKPSGKSSLITFMVIPTSLEALGYIFGWCARAVRRPMYVCTSINVHCTITCQTRATRRTVLGIRLKYHGLTQALTFPFG